MANVRIKTGDTETLQTVPLIDKYTGELVKFKTNVKAKIRRLDGDVFDWSDSTFKAVGSVTQLLQVLTAVDNTNFPGEYQTSFDTSAIVNPNADDTYEITVIEDGTSDVINLPQTGEIKVGDYIDTLLTRTNRYQVFQSYAYDFNADQLIGQVWVEHDNTVVSSVDVSAASVRIFDADGVALFPAITDLTADAQGVFKVVKGTPPGLVANKSFYAEASVSVAGVGTIKSVKGLFTVG